MALVTPVKDQTTAPATTPAAAAAASSTTPSYKPWLSQPSPFPNAPTPSPVKPDSSIPATPRIPPTPTPSSDADLVCVPSYSKWFSWDGIHECEMRFLPEFFDSRSPSKNPRVYMSYRNSIIKQFRKNPSAKISFTDVRKALVGDVGSIRRVFDFLEAWGLVNYSPPSSNKPLKWEDKDSINKSNQNTPGTTADGGDSSAPPTTSRRRVCSGCKSVCSIACFACDKYDLTLCARCYVRGQCQGGVTNSDFRRVEISEDTRNEWTEKETLQLLEAVTHFGDDWKKVAQYVGGKSEKDCVTQFIKLPFGEEFSSYTNSGEADNQQTSIKDPNDSERQSENAASSPNKRMRLSPLADASNPIMAQVAFLSALTGPGIAEAAAGAAVRTLNEVEFGASKSRLSSLPRNAKQQDANVASNGSNLNELEKACLEANSMLEKEAADIERAIAEIVEVQMKEIIDKIVRFEELDLQLEKEWQQLEQMKNLLFVDQLTFLSHKRLLPKSGEIVEEHVKKD